MGTWVWHTGTWTLAEKFLKEALDRRMRVSERMYIESHFYCAAGQFGAGRVGWPLERGRVRRGRRDEG